MGDYISWLAVYPFLKSFFLSRVTLLFPAIVFFRLLSFCTSLTITYMMCAPEKLLLPFGGRVH